MGSEARKLRRHQQQRQAKAVRARIREQTKAMQGEQRHLEAESSLKGRGFRVARSIFSK